MNSSKNSATLGQLKSPYHYFQRSQGVFAVILKAWSTGTSINPEGTHPMRHEQDLLQPLSMPFTNKVCDK